MEKTVELLCKKFRNERCYHQGTVNEIAENTKQELDKWDNDCAAKLSIVKGAFHFYSSEKFNNHKDSLFALHLNTSISSHETEGMTLLYPYGTDCGFADANLKNQLNDSKIAFAFGEKGSSLWTDTECKQLINYITHNKKTYLYLSGGENTRVISHDSSFLPGKFYEIQLDSDSCIIGYFDFACNTGSANHYIFDSYNGKWEIDYNFAHKENAFGSHGVLFYPRIDFTQIQKGIRTDIVDFAEHYLKKSPPSLDVIDWEVDNSHGLDIYLQKIADELSKELYQRIKDKENYIFVYTDSNGGEETEAFLCSSSNIFRVFIFQNNIQEAMQSFDSRVLNRLYSGHLCPNDNVKPDNTAVILLHVKKAGNTPFSESNSSINILGTDVPVSNSSVSFAWLNYLNLIIYSFAEKYVNPEKQKIMSFAINNDNSNIAMQVISPTKESGSNTNPDIFEKLESINSNNQANRRSEGVEKGDAGDGR